MGIFRGRAYLKNREKELKDYFGVRHLFLVSSGKAALTVILQALKSLSPEKHEVLIPAYTCFSVPSAIVKAGLKVSLCDIDASAFDFNYELLGEAVHEDTLCVVPAHLFGMPSDIDRINALCREKGIFVVEDAAQAMGGSYKGKKLGTLGDVGFFSMGRGKNITCGSGGIIVTNADHIASAVENACASLERPCIPEDLAEFLKMAVLSLLIHPSLYWLPAGLPFLKLGETVFYRDFPIKRFSGMKAGLLKNWKKRLEESNSIRGENAEQLSAMLGLPRDKDFSIPFLRLPFVVNDRRTRDGIYSLSRKKGRGISCMYPTSVNEIEEIQGSFDGKAFPCAAGVAPRMLTLPTHQLLTEKDKRDISELFRKASPAQDPGRNKTYIETSARPSDLTR